MTSLLHLTNGTAVIPAMRDAAVGGLIVSWDDVLHEGPVPGGLSPAALGERRAEFLAGCGWGTYDEIARTLRDRDSTLADAISGPLASSAARPVDEVVLWFEHDLYDQLQILQILDRLPLDGAPRVTAVPDDDYLGTLPAARLQGLFAARRDVGSSERLTARDAWTAFRSSDPRAITDVLPRAADLPHLAAALLRHLEQFPSTSNGLSRTEQQALEVVSSGVTQLREVYTRSHHGREAAVFMGDAAFLVHIEALLQAPRPLLRRADRPLSHGLSLDEEVTLTDDGRQVLEGRMDRVSACGINRWLGGVELAGNGPVWRWDEARRTVRWR